MFSFVNVTTICIFSFLRTRFMKHFKAINSLVKKHNLSSNPKITTVGVKIELICLPYLILLCQCMCGRGKKAFLMLAIKLDIWEKSWYLNMTFCGFIFTSDV